MGQQDDISVIMPVYNKSDTVVRALQSVFDQTLSPSEIIVVDDKSDDDLAAALKPYRDRITYIRHEKNLGAAAARNTGVQAARCFWVAFLDADDAWHKDKLSYQLDFMKKQQHEQAEASSMASCTSFTVHRDGRSQSYTLSEKENFSQTIYKGCSISPGSTLMMARSIVKKVGPFPTDLPRLEDWAWLLQLVNKGLTVKLCPQNLCDVHTTGFPDFTTMIRSLQALRTYVQRYGLLTTKKKKRLFEAALCTELAAAHYREARRLYKGKKTPQEKALMAEGRKGVDGAWHVQAAYAIAQLAKSGLLDPRRFWQRLWSCLKKKPK